MAIVSWQPDLPTLILPFALSGSSVLEHLNICLWEVALQNSYLGLNEIETQPCVF